MIRIGIIGFGYWGKILARNVAATPGCILTSIAEERTDRYRLASELYPDARMYKAGRDLLKSDECDAVVIATHLSSHFSLCKTALQFGRHVLVEKPMVASIAQASELVELADKMSVRLSVDHTFLYSGPIRALKNLISGGHTGGLIYLDSVRINFGSFRPDANVIWDLAAHDFAIMGHLFDARPVSLSANAVSISGYPLECAAHIAVRFEGGALAHAHVNWLAPDKVRKMTLCGSRQMVVYDDLEPCDKVRVYRRYADIDAGHSGAAEANLQEGECFVWPVDLREPVAELVREFVAAIEERRETITSGVAGRRVVALLEATDRSLRAGGDQIRVVSDS